MTFPMNQEIWRAIDGYIKYEISNHGRVRNSTTGRILKPYMRGKKASNEQGYGCVDFQKDCKRNTFSIHRLVAFAFCDNPDNLPMVDHIDRDKHNNHYENLRWVSNQENQKNINIRTSNKSGMKGLHFEAGKHPRWRGMIQDNNMKGVSKSFSVKTYGHDEAKQLASEWRLQKEIEFGYITA